MASERFRDRRRVIDADREVDSFLAETTTPLDVPILEEGIAGPAENISKDHVREAASFPAETMTPIELPLVEEGTPGPAKIMSKDHKALISRIDKLFYNRIEPSAEYGLSPAQIKHTPLSELGIQPHDVLAQCHTVFHSDDYFWEHLHDLRCRCEEQTHHLELMDQIKYNLLHDPEWYLYQDPSSELGDFSDDFGTLDGRDVLQQFDFNAFLKNDNADSEDCLACDPFLTLSDLPVPFDVDILQLHVNMSWLHDPYCACQQPEHRAQLRREWGDRRKAMKTSEMRDVLEEYLLGHMCLAHRNGYIGNDILSPQDPSQTSLEPRDPAVARVGMINSHTGKVATPEIVEENPFGEHTSTESSLALQDYQIQLMLLEKQNKKRLSIARQEQDSSRYGPMSKLFPDYAGLPLDSRAIPFDVLVTLYQQVVTAAFVQLPRYHFLPIPQDAIDVPSLLKDQERQESAYLRGQEYVILEKGKDPRVMPTLPFVERKVGKHLLQSLCEFWARETLFTADVEQAYTDSPFAIARRFRTTYMAENKCSMARKRDQIQDEFDRCARVAVDAEIQAEHNEASAPQSTRWSSAYYATKQIQYRLRVLEEKRLANQAFSEQDTVKGTSLIAHIDTAQAVLWEETNRQSQRSGVHALQDYQMELMLLEQQNKKRLLMARQEQDSAQQGPNAGPTDHTIMQQTEHAESRSEHPSKADGPFSELTSLHVNKKGYVEDEEGNAVGVITSGNAKELVGMQVDEDGAIIDRYGNTQGRAGPIEEEEGEEEEEDEEEEEQTPEDLSALAVEQAIQAWEAEEQSRIRMHDVADQASLVESTQTDYARTQIANSQRLSMQMREMDEQLRTQHAVNQASAISAAQTTQADSQTQQSAQSPDSQQTSHSPTSLNQQVPPQSRKRTHEPDDEDVQMEEFHCPYPACHNLLAGGEAVLKVEKDGRSEIWCAHDGCLESYTSTQRWRRHICTPHHDLLGLGTRSE